MQFKERWDSIFARIEVESPQDRAERWRGMFDRVAAPLNDQLVLFGSGQFGQLARERLRQAGVEPCCFSDNNPDKWGTEVDGLPVLSPEDAARRYGQTAAFVVTIFNGSKARQQLTAMGCRRVLPVTLLYWKYPEQFMPDLGIGEPDIIANERGQIEHCFNLLHDDQSRRELCDQIVFRYWMEPEFLPVPGNVGETYFPTDIVSDKDDEVFVDCGAYDGDSIRSFLRRGRNFSYLYALEPDAGSRVLLATALAALPAEVSRKVKVWPYAASSFDGPASFAAMGTIASKVSAAGAGPLVEARRLDSLDWEYTPTYIKMDIEASEPDALAGAATILRHEQPVLAVCQYHRLEHLWQIPNLIHSLSSDYRLFLRRYAEDTWEQVCYAVPQDRLVS